MQQVAWPHVALPLFVSMKEGPLSRARLDSQLSRSSTTSEAASSAHLSIASSREDQASWERLRVRNSKRAIRPPDEERRLPKQQR